MTSPQREEQSKSGDAPPTLTTHAEAAATAAQQDHRASSAQAPDHHLRTHHGHHNHTPESVEHVPRPPFNSTDYGQLDISQNGLDTGARIAEDGRINIKINERSRKLSNLLVPALRTQLRLQREQTKDIPPYIPPGLAGVEGLPPPPMNVVIQIVGSRGDVQPFIALGQVLKRHYKHRVRIATHPIFRDFVTENGLEFFSIGGDPTELMAFMVKNPGLMPGFDSLKSGDVGKRRRGIYEIITGCWRSCIEPGDGTGVKITDDILGNSGSDSGIPFAENLLKKPFVADAIIANPPSFAHIHVAEKLGVPLHLMFTMPWSPTQSFPHPLANIMSSNVDSNMTNFLSYALVDMLTWQGLGDVINKFRQKSLGLEQVSIMWAPGMSSRLRIPWTYCWSPALIPKPADWGDYVDVSGFFFLNLAANYTPPPKLAQFLEAGPPPIYIGFGSIVVDDPNAMTTMIFEAIKKTGRRALVSKGWGGLGADQIGIPEGVFMLGNCPHDWLFKRVSCVVHHGGAGTTAAGIAAGRPTVVVPFFGDQPFWGAMCARAGAGPFPIPYKDLTANKLADQISEALKPKLLERAAVLAEKIRQENGNESGAQSFHKQLKVDGLRCSLYPWNVAVWKVKKTNIRLSTLAAAVLGNEGLLDFSELKLYRAREYETENGPWEPISGGAAALIGTIGNLTMGLADFPVELLRSLKYASAELKQTRQSPRESIISGTAEITSPDGATGPSNQDEHPTASTEDKALPPRQSFMSLALGESKLGSCSRSSSRSRSRAGSPSPSVDHRYEVCRDEVGKLTAESAIHGAKAVGKIVSVGMKSPMDFTMALAKGFHNAPKLYGDDTVRKTEKITGIGSGLKAAAKEFHYGFYDGISGLVTQPLSGAKKEGAAGFFKGAAKGIGGLILKPGAGIWGLPGYTFKGIHAELQKHFGQSVQYYIIAARTAQGYEEWEESSPEQRIMIIDAWKAARAELRKQGKNYGKEKDAEIQELAEPQQIKKEREREKEVSRPLAREGEESPDLARHFPLFSHHPSQDAGDYEEAIKRSVSETSQGDPQEDAIVERALRASVRELQLARASGNEDDEAVKKAITASVEEAKRAREELAASEKITDSLQEKTATPAAGGDREHDLVLERALTQSLEEFNGDRPSSGPFGYGGSDSGLDTEDDEDYKKAIEDSRRLHFGNVTAKELETTVGDAQVTLDTATRPDMTDSVNQYEDNDMTHDEELKRATELSYREHQEREMELRRQQTEEEIVVEYVKKQSLLEEEHKRKMREGRETRVPDA